MNTEKSPEAFRTISEVADWLGTPTHVLRFWESRFREIKPVKRAGGRRYYRPADMELLGGIKRLLHEDGMTIRGVQKLLREQGVRRVADLSPPLTQDGLPASFGAQDAADSRGGAPAVSTGSSAHPERPGPPWPPDEMPTPLSAGMSAGDDSAPAQAEAPRYSAAPWPKTEGPATEGPATEGAEAGMVEDASDDADRSAEIVPFVLDTRLRSDRRDTPDLFDTPAPDRGAAMSADTPDQRSGNPALRLPAIPPDPDDAAPLSPGAHRPLRGFRRPPGRPGDRLAQLYEKLSSLRGRMPRG